MAKTTNGEAFSFADDTEPTKTVVDQPQVLLDWIIRFWTRPSITARDIGKYGPSSMRNKETILNLANDLVERGWLIPQPTWRRDKREWKIAPGLPLGK